MKFVRIHGRVVPIRDQEDGLSKKKAGAGGALAGAAYHTRKGIIANSAEKLAKNHRSLAKFKANLQPGDILVMGSAPKHSGGHEVGGLTAMLPKGVKTHAEKLLKKAGIKSTDVFASNSSILTASGAGSKYHAGVYLGKGKVAHMSTDAGAVIEKLGDVVEKQNVSALRFANASKSETNSAIKFAKAAAKKKVPYQKTMGITSGLSNLVAPIGKKASQNFSEMVCHTLPIRSYAKRGFALGEHTYAGDFMKTPGISAIARHDVMKTGLTNIKAFVGNSAKGLKWGVAAFAGAAAINYALKKRKEK